MNKTDKANLDMLIASLKTHVAEVRFTKVDSSERLLHCTLNPAFFADKLPSTERTLEELENSPVVRVYEVDLQEWRSFRKDSLIEWKCI